jgi:hypothetical protein
MPHKNKELIALAIQEVVSRVHFGTTSCRLGWTGTNSCLGCEWCTICPNQHVCWPRGRGRVAGYFGDTPCDWYIVLAKPPIRAKPVPVDQNPRTPSSSSTPNPADADVRGIGHGEPEDATVERRPAGLRYDSPPPPPFLCSVL